MKKWAWIVGAGVVAFVAYRLWKRQPVPFVGSLFKAGGPLTPPAAPLGAVPGVAPVSPADLGAAQ